MLRRTFTNDSNRWGEKKLLFKKIDCITELNERAQKEERRSGTGGEVIYSSRRALQRGMAKNLNLSCILEPRSLFQLASVQPYGELEGI